MSSGKCMDPFPQNPESNCDVVQPWRSQGLNNLIKVAYIVRFWIAEITNVSRGRPLGSTGM